MKLRVTVFTIAFVALMAVVGGRSWYEDCASSARPSTEASKRSTTASQVQVLEQRVASNPRDIDGLTQLGQAYVTRARESADPSFYALADTAMKRALAIDADNVQATILAGGIALSKHDFAGALVLGEKAHQLAPDVAAAYAVMADALVELGRYDEAAAAAQELADRRPDFAAYSRASYLRELHGDTDGAIEAMRKAVDAGTGVSYDAVWGRVLLGNLYLTKGDVGAAASEYEHAASILPDEPVAKVGLARLAIAQGDLGEAERQLRPAVEVRPLAEYVILFGDVLQAEGKAAEADQQYALVRAVEQLFAANGVDTDVELALFEADHGADPERAYATAMAAYARRQSVVAADALAWSAFKAGHLEVAVQYSAMAMRLGSREPLMRFHAGMIAKAAGELELARTYLRDATQAPNFSVLYAATAVRALDEITASARGG